ncbi:MAG: efflux RND transporter permease subunit [Pirellulales bacterium]|nr:efflux RND transporter permease subunit [Pirellulales bacterium]
MKAPEEERDDIDNLGNTPVWGSAPASVPLRQLVSGLKIEWEDPIIHRRQRRPTITAQCDPNGALADDVFRRLRPKIEAIRLPADYRLEWGGQHDASQTAQNMVFSRLPIAMILMAVIVVALFNNLRQPLIILLTLPLAIIGITAGLLLTGTPFGFMALLGAMSLFGMLIKNAVVLLDEVNVQLRSGAEPYEALVRASVSRMRPVMMASLTTVAGMLPLVTDPLFDAMAITIMFGLMFATVLTLIVVPLLYAILYGVRPAAG